MGAGLKVLLGFAVLIIIVIVFISISKADKKIGKYKVMDYKVNKSVFTDWERVFEQPGNISLETLHAGNVSGTVAGMVNIKNKDAAEIIDENVNAPLTAPLFAHLIHHEKFGDYLIDTGFDSIFAEKAGGNFEGLGKKHFKFTLEKGQGIEEQLKKRNIKLSGVFCTHFHEHQGGAPSLPDDLPFVFGKGEKEMDFYPLLYSRFLMNKTNLQEIDFDKADDMPLVGKAVDVFGDGSLWALSTPGHTKGHTSYFINGVNGRHMIMGDICMCKKGYDVGVESGGTYADNLEKNRESFLKIKKFIDTYPDVKPVFGHESEEFRINYK